MSEDSRMQALEELAAHQAGEIESLSEQVRDQWQRIDDLTASLLRLRDRMSEVEDSGSGPHENTPPPHY